MAKKAAKKKDSTANLGFEAKLWLAADTVPIYYEARVVKLSFDDAAIEAIDEEFDDVTEAEEVKTQEKLKTKWAALEAMVGNDDRLKVVRRIWSNTLKNGRRRWTARA